MRESERVLERESKGGNGTSRVTNERGCPVKAKRRGYFNHLDQSTKSFFFTNLLEGFKVSALWIVFLSFSKVREVYVPLKSDRSGRRFGFVKFQEVSDVEELEWRLGEVWLGDTRLKVNIAKFGREDRLTDEVLARKEVIGGSAGVVTKDPSFTQVVQQGLNGGVASVVLRRVVVLPSEERLKELECCFVAVLAFQREAKQVHNSLVLGGMKHIGVSSMGANMVLLKAAEPKCIEQVERRHDSWWRGLFSSVKRWSPNLMAQQRRVWLRFFGLPLHVWEEKCFKQSRALFGDFVDFDEDTINLNRLDLARICVNTSNMAFINEKLRLEIMGAIFDVWVVEQVESAVVSRRLEDSGWDEGSSASSNCGRGGGVLHEFLDDGDEVSPRALVSVRLMLRR